MPLILSFVSIVLLVSLSSLTLTLTCAKPEPFPSTKARQSKVPKALKEACKGNLDLALSLVKKENTAGALHILSALMLLLEADAESAVFVHELAREKDPKLIPPLAQLYLDGETCNGLGDVFYVLAVTIKRLKDSKVSRAVEFEAYTTLVTLLSDSGLPQQAEIHLQKAKTLEPDRAELKIRGALMTPGVYTSSQHINETRVLLQSRLDALSADQDFSLQKLNEFAMSPTFYLVYQGLSDVDFLTALHDVYARGHPVLHSYPSNDTYSLPFFPPVHGHLPTSSAAAIGAVDADANADSVAYTAASESANAGKATQPLRVGFVSSHFRRHSICKLYCGIIQDLATTKHVSRSGDKTTAFQVYAFSGQDESREDKYTKQLRSAIHLFVRLARFTVPARQEVLKRDIDVLVYLDVGMDPSTTVWAASRLAPIQMCLWGHPSTTGLRSMDYYISSDLFHVDQSTQYQRTEDTFLEQLVRLPTSLGTAFHRSTLALQVQEEGAASGEGREVTDQDLILRPAAFLSAVEATLGQPLKPSNLTYSPFGAPATVASLVALKRSGHVLILIPQHLPKFHPDFDVVMRELLEAVPTALVVITYDVKKSLWRQTLETRWSKQAGFSSELIKRRILWLESLSPQQYLAMLALGDVMVDPFPFGGGVTTLEALAVCTPVVTLPALQNVPALTAGMLRTLSLASSAGENGEIHRRNIFPTVEAFIEGARILLSDAAANAEMRTAICRDADSLFASSSTPTGAVAEWAELLATASTPSEAEVVLGTEVDKTERTDDE